LEYHDSKSGQLKNRTRQFAIWVVRMFDALPHKTSAYILGKQALRAGTSVGANYRAACRARSKAEFIAKIAVVSEEADECVFWLDLLQAVGLITEAKMAPLLKEAQELSAIFTASYNTARGKE
jgi:four helix bundle protein